MSCRTEKRCAASTVIELEARVQVAGEVLASKQLLKASMHIRRGLFLDYIDYDTIEECLVCKLTDRMWSYPLPCRGKLSGSLLSVSYVSYLSTQSLRYVAFLST